MKKNAILLGTVFALLSALSSAQVPFVNQPLVPSAMPPGAPEFILTVDGTGFAPDAIVNWNGVALTTRFVSASRLTATVPAGDIASASTGSVTVINPVPGGGTSNVVYFTVTRNVRDSIGFDLFSSPATGQHPAAVVAGDFNGDGKLDLAVANQNDNTLSILLGDGTGNFTVGSTPATGGGPSAVAVGDFNGDGKLDLAVANQYDSTLSILFGDGAGNFTMAASVGTDYPSTIAVADFDLDGKLDLAVGSGDAETVSVLLGDGTGGFTLASSVPGGDGLAVGDFNRDGRLDLAVADRLKNTVTVFLGDGIGNFSLGWREGISWSGPFGLPSSVAAGDFSRDGKLDLVVVNDCFVAQDECNGPSFLSIMLGDGKGNFSVCEHHDCPAGAFAAVLGNFNGDRKLDIALGDGSVLLGDGTGNFALGISGSTGWRSSVAVGDFNADGKLDLVLTNPDANTVSVLLQVTPTVMIVSPTSLDFGGQSIDTVSAPRTITLTNPGKRPVNFTSIVVLKEQPWYLYEPDFAQTNDCGASLAPGTSCTIQVAFQPLYPGPLATAVSVTDDAAHSPQTVSLTGVGTDFATASPTSLDFGDKPVGTTSSPQTINFTTHAHFPFTFNYYLDGDSSVWSTKPCGDKCVSVTFTPNSLGALTATFGMAWFDDLPECYGWCFLGVKEVPLTGVGSGVGLSPSTLNFGSQTVGTISAVQTIVLTNYASASWRSISKIAATDNFSQTNNCRSRMAPGSSCTINVTFRPPVCGKFTGTITITDDALNSPQQVSLSGVGVTVQLAPAALDFGSQPLRTTSTAQIVTLTNHTERTVHIFGISLNGTNPGSFAQTNTCGTSVAAGASCTITVTFTPLARGARTANLSVRYDAGGTPQQIPLTGNGV